MKHLVLFFMLATTTAATAQKQQKLELEKATVFIRGAELTSTASISLSKGENEFLLSNVAGNINTQSISVAATNGVVVEQATFQNNFIQSENVSPKVAALKDSLEAHNGTREGINNKIMVLNQMISVLETNKKVNGENSGLNVAEMIKLLDLLNSRMEGYLVQKSKLKKQRDKEDSSINRLKKQVAEEQKKDYQPGGQLLVKFFAREATNTDITISYVVNNAGWSPIYDIWADDSHSPIKFFYKANIYQNCGVKWDNVHLTLSTGNPTEGMQTPALSPWLLSFYAPQPTYYNNVPARNAMGKQNALVASSEENSFNFDKIVLDNETPPARAGLSNSSMNNYVTVSNEGVNTSFDIELPYTIPSDGQQHLVAVKKYETPAIFEYFAIPKADKDAFLIAKISNWEDLNLLPGSTNIFFEGTFVGQGAIDTRNTSDTLSVSLGRDKKIVVKRERNKKLRTVKMIGTNVREAFVYDITVRNTRKENIKLTLLDQLPVSNYKDIVIEDVDTGDAEKDETTGKLGWTLNLAPNETKKVSFAYTVRYPKGKTLVNNR